MIRAISDIKDRRLNADVCIVGSGAAGITLARELVGSGLRTVVLEGGRRQFDARSQKLYDSELCGLSHAGIHSYRFRVFGGATTRWAGQALPLFEIDFQQRDWVAHSGWPIARDELLPYYTRAASIMGIDAFPENARDGWPQALPAPAPFDPKLIAPFFSQFSAQPNFATTHGAALEYTSDVDIVLGANVTELITGPGGTEVQAARVSSLDGESLDVHAGLFVLCAGGIETARILLASDRYSEGGLGNGQDLVGRYFQDHPGITVGRIVPREPRQFSEAFRARKARGIKLQPFFGLSEELQRDERLLNSFGAVLFHMTQSASIDAGKVIFRALRHAEFRSEARTAAKTVVREPLPLLGAATRHFLLGRPALNPNAAPQLTVACEQVPNSKSRVFLSDACDATGMRRSVLDWHLTEAEIRTWRRSAEVIATEFERLGIGSVDLDGLEIPDDPEQLSGRVVDTGHHMGTTRMSNSAEAGVVDPNCRVFGVDNLYVASSAVFPTSGTANPTFTIIALAIRIADTIKRSAPRAAAVV